MPLPLYSRGKLRRDSMPSEWKILSVESPPFDVSGTITGLPELMTASVALPPFRKTAPSDSWLESGPLVNTMYSMTLFSPRRRVILVRSKSINFPNSRLTAL